MRTVFFDIDTQFDFVLPAGALYVPGAEQILPVIGRIAKHAGANSIPLISTTDAHSEDDQEFSIWKPHCVVGTTGQQKPLSTLLPQSLLVSTKPLDASSLAENARLSGQMLLEKQQTDCFTNPNLRPLLEILKPDTYIVYGVATDVCVQQAVLGLLAWGAQVQIVTDATCALDQSKADRLFKDVQRQGGKMITSSELIG